MDLISITTVMTLDKIKVTQLEINKDKYKEEMDGAKR